MDFNASSQARASLACASPNPRNTFRGNWSNRMIRARLPRAVDVQWSSWCARPALISGKNSFSICWSIVGVLANQCVGATGGLNQKLRIRSTSASELFCIVVCVENALGTAAKGWVLDNVGLIDEDPDVRVEKLPPKLKIDWTWRSLHPEMSLSLACTGRGM